MGNVVMFESPVAKVYHTLPLSRTEFSEVLAFVFLGSAKPTEQDFEHTPMLVRRHRVQAALEWLKLNHCDYEHLTILHANLADLPQSSIFCGVEWKETASDDSNPVPESLSIDNDGTVDDGTASGPCPFVVAGLTGPQYDQADMRTLKAKALEHWKNGGGTLGVGHANEPTSMYRNVQLYPQMFPWLFPYRKGGIGHSEHQRSISEDTHKMLLLISVSRLTFIFPW
ncbi:hypothetical protein C8R45DRAFT_1053229 [Mycena sanguinolenta]|nr:hypothetical protein C8R45DRAFT_1053229 [Mycena sanguinolenta]